MRRRPPRSTLFPDTRLCRSRRRRGAVWGSAQLEPDAGLALALDAPAVGQLGHEVETPSRGARRVRDALADHEALAPVAYLDAQDRKSTRLNSSHANISYAVF